MKSVYFKPWVGRKYRKEGFLGLRVLILGESHYEWEDGQELDPELTRDCVREQLVGDSTKAFWTRIAAVFTGTPRPTQAEKLEFWNAVAFYNFIQTSAGRGPNARPGSMAFNEAAAPFHEVLKRHRPHFLCVLGRVWYRLPDKWESRRRRLKSAPGGWNNNCYFDLPNGHRIFALSIKHPSRGFSFEQWRPVITEGLEIARNLIPQAAEFTR